jgi:maleamate amidohydrolase
VRASVVDALQCGFGPFVIEDACADRSVTQHESNLVDMESKYAQLVSSEELIELALARI